MSRADKGKLSEGRKLAIKRRAGLKAARTNRERGNRAKFDIMQPERVYTPRRGQL
jgi:hypothetical protein